MKPLKCWNWSGRIQSLTPPAVTIAIFAGLNLLMREPAWGAGVVTSCSEGSLRVAMAGGGTVTFACDGTIALGNPFLPPSHFPYPIPVTANTVLDGTGHQITISGTNTVEGMFFVSNNVTLVLVNLTLANGLSTNGGGAICIQTGTVCATNCTFTGNTAMPGTNFYPQLLNDAQGGAIRNEGGYVNLQNCLFTSNSAVPVPIGIYAYGNGAGGALFNTGSLIMDNCQFVQNRAVGGDGDPYSGWAYGGAIFNAGNAVIGRSSFISNSAAGGAGLPGLDGHGVTPPGPGGDGGDAYGSAIYSGGTLLLANCTVAANTAIAGSGGLGGQGYPFRGQDGASGSAYGAICGGNLINVTVAFNSAGCQLGHKAGSAVGGIYGCSLTNCTVASNNATAGGVVGSTSVGGFTMGSLANTMLAGNSPSNSSGTITEGGHNLSSDASCAFTAAGSMNNTDPKLGPLADNGGPTWTMALLPGSPAIDAGTALGAPTTDQRGVPRPQGAGVDIGAFEYQYIPVFTGATMLSATNCRLQMAGLPPNQTYSLQVSSNLVTWSSVTNFMAGSNGVFQCIDPTCTSGPARFYRLKSGTP